MSGKNFVKGATIGALLASVATLFLAPKSGKGTRGEVSKIVSSVSKKIAKELEEKSTLTKDTYDEIIRTSLREYGRGKGKAKEFISDLSSVFQEHFPELTKSLSQVSGKKKAKKSKP